MPGAGGFFHAEIEAFYFLELVLAGDIEVGIGGGVGYAAVVGGDHEAEIDHIFHPRGAAGF